MCEVMNGINNSFCIDDGLQTTIATLIANPSRNIREEKILLADIYSYCVKGLIGFFDSKYFIPCSSPSKYLDVLCIQHR